MSDPFLVTPRQAFVLIHHRYVRCNWDGSNPCFPQRNGLTPTVLDTEIIGAFYQGNTEAFRTYCENLNL